MYFQIEITSSLGLDITLTDVRETDHSFISGLAGRSVAGSLAARNGTLYSNSSNEEAFYEFGNSCKLDLNVVAAFLM